MSKAAKPKKPRAKKYDEKVAVECTFADVFKLIKKNKEDKEKKSKEE